MTLIRAALEEGRHFSQAPPDEKKVNAAGRYYIKILFARKDLRLPKNETVINTAQSGPVPQPELEMSSVSQEFDQRSVSKNLVTKQNAVAGSLTILRGFGPGWSSTVPPYLLIPEESGREAKPHSGSLRGLGSISVVVHLLCSPGSPGSPGAPGGLDHLCHPSRSPPSRGGRPAVSPWMAPYRGSSIHDAHPPSPPGDECACLSAGTARHQKLCIWDEFLKIINDKKGARKNFSSREISLKLSN